MIRSLVVVATILASLAASAQTVTLSEWRTLSSLRTVRSADVDARGRIWAATSGGVILYDRSANNIQEFRNVDALQTLDCTSLLCDRASGVTYIGQGDGALDAVDADGVWTNIAEIRRATQYTRRRINDMIVRGDTLLIATDFGIVLYNRRNGTFIETVDRIGALQEKTRVSGLCILRDSLWASTDSGVAVAPLRVSTLRLPSVWTNLNANVGLDAARITTVRTNGTTVAVSTEYTAFVWENNRFVSRIGTTTPINGLSFDVNGLAVSTKDGLRTLNGPLALSLPGETIGHTQTMNLLVMFVKDLAFGYGDTTAVTMVPVNSPVSNQFAHLSIDTRGGLWVATDVDPPRTGLGVSYFDGSAWRNITTSTQPLLGSNACYKVSSLSDGSTWIGTWGGGTLRCTPTDTGVVFEDFDNKNSSLAGISVDPNYVLVAEVARDRSGRTWVLNEQAADRLFGVLEGASWTSATNCVDARRNIFRTLAIDGAGAVWAGSPTGDGVVVYNDRTTDNRSDDICNVVRTSNSQLPDNVISVIRADKAGAMWIGTAKGVAVVTSPASLSNTTVPFVRRISALANAVVTDIHVDALNYKWIATTGGVFVLNEDGTEVIATVTKANTPLLDDNIRSITVDESTGLAYFGTTNGCSVAKSSSLRPLDTYAVRCYPQPFRPDADGNLIIDGLAPEADIRIMTANGTLVAALQARGRQATWDGRDVNGNVVPPGVYVLSTSSAVTNGSAAAKIAVTR